MAYLSTAESIAEGKGIRDYSQTNLVLYPPLYPLLLAFIHSLGIDLSSASRILNILFLGLIILLTGHCLSRYIKSRLLVVGTTVIVMTSYALNHLASHALSEISFILFTLLALMQIGAFMQEKTRRTFALSVFFTALAPITRYIGFTVIITAVILLLINQNVPFIKRLRHATIHGIISSLPLAGLLIYNRSVTGWYTGDRPWAIGQSLYGSLWEMIDALYVWFYYPLYQKIPPPAWLRYYLWTMAGLFLLAISIIIYNNFKQSDSKKVKSHLSINLFHILPFIVFILVYTISLLITVPRAAGQIIDSRYLSPVYVPIIIVGSVLFIKYFSGGKDGQLLRFALILLIISSCVVYSYRAVKWNTETTVRALESKHHPPIFGYTPNSPIIDYLNVNPLDSGVHTNRPSVLYHLTDIPPPVWTILPRNFGANCSQSFQLRVEVYGEEYFIFLTMDEAFDRYRASCDFRKIATQYEYLELVVETSDGVVYRTVPPREPVPG